MSETDGDFLNWVERELRIERAKAVRAYDRADALAQLYSKTLHVACDVRREVTVGDVFASARDEHERAQLSALAERISGPGGDPASDVDPARGHREETAEGL